MKVEEEDHLAHYGTPRRSGRYPWGSGGNNESSEQRNKSFLAQVESMKGQGLSEKDIAEGVGMSVTQLRNLKSIAKNEQKAADIRMAQRLKGEGYSNGAIAERMNLAGESSVRALLNPSVQRKVDVKKALTDRLRERVEEKGALDVGSGVEYHLGVSKTNLDIALTALQNEGYEIHNVKVPQLGTGNMTNIKVLARTDVAWSDMVRKPELIHTIQDFSDDGGLTFNRIMPPLSVDSKRIGVKYAEEGGAQADGVIYLRRGVEDISLGGAKYAQVRIAVDGTHYLKGMAMYKDDMPAGVDLLFNTNKSNTGSKHDAMKKLEDDPENPFGSIVRQRIRVHPDGKREVVSALNIVGMKEGSGEEGAWDEWSRNLSTQMLSKQQPSLARKQLDETYKAKQQDLNEILTLTNPAVRRKLLDDYADGADSASVHLKAAALPRQRTSVILPMNSMKENEIYAPNFNNGERVVLVRHPHGGLFEIPELVVNNRNPAARKAIGSQAKDAVGIHHKVAERLSGADFDGDTVLVIPNDHGLVRTAPPLAKLKNFDPKSEYPAYEGMKKMTPEAKGLQMGLVSNLITDMTIKGATNDELARAVRHSMVVIDAEKHNLNYRQSAKDNGISALMAKYQKGPQGGASTLISRAKTPVDVLERKPSRAKDGGPIDKETGKKKYTYTNASYVDRNGKTVMKSFKSKKLAETEDANSLSSGTPMEGIYANHSNRLKALANQARKESVNTPSTPYSPSAKKQYSKEVDSLNAKLNLALRNRPLERHAQVIAGQAYRAKLQANPNMEASEKKKYKYLALEEARTRVGAKREQIDLTDDEWHAIQAGAISNHKLEAILNNADMERVKTLATPRQQLLMTSSKTARAKMMLDSGHTQAEVAAALGVSLTTLKTTLNG